MKIGLVIDDSLNKTDGVQQYVLSLGTWLSDQGHEVCYISSGDQNESLPSHYAVTKNFRVKYNKNYLSIPYPASKKRLTKIIKQQNFDLVHVQMPFNPFFAARLIKMLGKRTAVVATFHIFPYSPFNAWLTRYFLKSQIKSLARLDEIICVSKAARKFLQSSVNQLPCRTLPNLINAQAFKTHGPTNEKLRIVMLGRLVERKGAKYLIQAFSELDKNLRDKTELIIAGTGPLLKNLKDYAKQKNVDAKFVGFISEAEKPELLSSATIAAFPSTGGESFGIVLLEAMASGAGVVIGGDNDGYRNVLKPGSMLIQPQNTRGFARLLKTLLSDKNFRNNIHEIQQDIVKRYDVAAVGPQILEVYHDAIAKKSQNGNN